MKKHKLKVREGLCPICYKPLDKHQGMEFCCKCGYKKEVG